MIDLTDKLLAAKDKTIAVLRDNYAFYREKYEQEASTAGQVSLKLHTALTRLEHVTLALNGLLVPNPKNGGYMTRKDEPEPSDTEKLRIARDCIEGDGIAPLWRK